MHRMTFIVLSWLTLTKVQGQLVLDYFHLQVHFTLTLARNVVKVLVIEGSNFVTVPVIIDMPTWSLWCNHCVTSPTPIEQECESWLGLQSFLGLITSTAHCSCKHSCVHSIGPADSYMLYTIGVHVRLHIDWNRMCDDCSVLCAIRNRNWETSVQLFQRLSNYYWLHIAHCNHSCGYNIGTAMWTLMV